MLSKGMTSLLLSLLIIPIIIVPVTVLDNVEETEMMKSHDDPASNIIDLNNDISLRNPIDKNQVLENHYTVSQDSFDGVLDPVSIEQRGYFASGTISSRTDTGVNTGTNLSLDTDHNWVADEAEVSVWNLEKLYAVNGSFDEGIAGTNVFPTGDVAYHPIGWDATSYNDSTYDDDVQLAAYDSSGRQYVTVESQGGKVGQNAFGHVAGTKILWTQEFVNAPYTEDFILSFDYFYLRGPIDGPTGTNPVTGNCSLTLFVNGTNVWNMSLLLLSQRGVWLETGDIHLSISGAPSSILFELGLVIDESLTLDKRYDYDGDPSHLPDGIDNSAYITVYIDDISFIKTVAPTPEQVQLEFATDSVVSPISYTTGIYNTTIVNASYWTVSPVYVELLSNTTISFDYEARLLSHRFTDSNWQTDVSDYGVRYSVSAGSSPTLSFYSYVGYLGGYEEPEMIIRYPMDWENATISDPFLTDLTSSCTISTGSISIPSSILDRLGWWQIDLESPNYAKSMNIQKFDVSSGWQNAISYRVGNETRPSIEIGTSTEIPSVLSNVNISWYLPNGTLWYYESASGGVDGSINGSSQILDNSMAGTWEIGYIWINGTEVAFVTTTFDVYHSSTLTPLDSMIETDMGEVVTGRVRFLDGDNGRYLMDDAIIKANWSGMSLSFNSNPTKNWWEVDLDTSLTGAGLFVVEANASLPYYDIAFCQFSVIATNVTRLTSPNSPWTSVAWESTAVLTFNYQRYDPIGSSWIPIANDSLDVVATVNWTLGEWTIVETGIAGIYEMSVNTGAKPIGNYLLNVSFSKPAHQTKQIVLALIITPQVSTLHIFNGTSTQVDIEDSIVLKMNYTDTGGHYIDGATILVDEVIPSTGLSISSIDPVSGESGNYSVSIIVNGIGVYTIRFLASKDDYQSASGVFVIVVNDVPTLLTVTSGETAEIGLGDPFTATYHFEMFNSTPIQGAVMSVFYSGPLGGLSWSDPVDEGSGDYSVEFDSFLSGAYLVTIAASKEYFQSDAVSFFLLVGDITSHLDIMNGSAKTIDFGESYRLVLSYYNNTPFGLAGADINILSITPSSGLSTTPIVDEGGGYYSLILEPETIDTFSILFSANLTNHQTQFATFTLVANPIPTVLKVMNATAKISVDWNYNLTLRFEDDYGNGIPGATIETSNAPEGITISSFTDVGDGYYQVNLDPQEVGVFTIVFKASKNSYQNISASYTLESSLIPTRLRFIDDVSSKTVDFGTNTSLEVFYERTDVLTNITLAEIRVTAGDMNFTISVTELDTGYSIHIVAFEVGVHVLTIVAEKTDYIQSISSYTLTVEEIGTSLSYDEFPEELYFDREYSSIFSYQISSDDSHVRNPIIQILGSKSDWVEINSLGSGSYNITIHPNQTGSYTISLFFSADGMESQSAVITFAVISIEVEAILVSPFTALEFQLITIVIDLVERGTTRPVTDADIRCKLNLPDTDWVTLTPQSAGRYSAQIQLPYIDATTNVQLLLFMDKENYQLVYSQQLSLYIEDDPIISMGPVITFSGSSIGILLVAIVGLRVNRSRRRKRNLRAIAIKQRFDDVKNMIGIILLHKSSGLPVFSKTLKGGFDESMVSAFITAVSHFRSEFGMDEKHWDFQVIPISDIISAVPTRNLICAFISGSTPSREQMVKMEAFGRAVGAMFDESIALAPTHVLDDETESIINALFMDMMDGEFLTAYRKREAAKLPRSMSCLSSVVGNMDKDEFTLDELARGMAMCGIEEGEAYLQVMDAIENDYILPANGTEPLILKEDEPKTKSYDFDFGDEFEDDLKPPDSDSTDSELDE